MELITAHRTLIRVVDFIIRAVLGATMAHLVVDAGAWRLSQSLQRKYIGKRFAFVFGTKSAAAIALIMLTGLLVQVRGQVKLQLDRTHDGLKGNVKTVSLEIVNFGFNDKGERVEKPRLPIQKTAYDEAGNQTRAEEYDDSGNLSLMMEYGFIGRQRVVRNTAPETSTALMTVVPLRKGKKFDSRYTYRLVYQYDAQGRRIQTLIYLSSGALWQKHVFRFAGNRKTHLLYSQGRLNQKLQYTFDVEGNESSVIVDAKYVSADKTVYKYDEFDAQGNWTRRTVYKGFTELSDDEFSRVHPWSVEYRTVTYY